MLGRIALMKSLMSVLTTFNRIRLRESWIENSDVENSKDSKLGQGNSLISIVNIEFFFFNRNTLISIRKNFIISWRTRRIMITVEILSYEKVGLFCNNLVLPWTPVNAIPIEFCLVLCLVYIIIKSYKS